MPDSSLMWNSMTRVLRHLSTTAPGSSGPPCDLPCHCPDITRPCPEAHRGGAGGSIRSPLGVGASVRVPDAAFHLSWSRRRATYIEPPMMKPTTAKAVSQTGRADHDRLAWPANSLTRSYAIQ